MNQIEDTTTTQNLCEDKLNEMEERIKELLEAKTKSIEANGVLCEEQIVLNDKVTVGKIIINNGKLNCSYINVMYGGSMGQLYSCSI